ncbi:MAG TPA: ribonuclease E/G, partial [Deferrisomatales bacterium]|nr:ribonuclease E/G [Deferrisomatales bacterium]
IARTAAEGRTKQELTRDAGYLLRLWETIQARDKQEKAPALLYEETDIVIRTLRDYFTPAIEEVLIDNEDMYRQVEAFFKAVMPVHSKRLKLYQGQAPLFSKHNLEDQIASIYAKKVPLPSGGSLVIEQTEALVSIDVNSGRTTSGKDIEETAFIANKEAAEEAARQLRLRDMGGLIVIDFIDMRPAKNRSEVRKVLQKALKEDKARTDTGTISKFGLLELSRQRIKGVARAGAIQPCPACSGLGTIRTPESSALSVLRRVQLRLPRKGAVRQVLVGVPGPVATLLQNRHRTKLMDLESRFGTEILVFAEEALSANQFYLEYRAKDRPEVETDLPEGFNRARLLAPQGLPDLPQRPRRPSLYPLVDEEPEAIEVPAEPDTEPETTEQVQEEAGSSSGTEETAREPGKKRRRRRRRGRGNGNRDGAEDNAPAEEGKETRFPAGGSGYSAAEIAAAEADAEAAELATNSEPRPLSAASKRRQRRKRATGRTGESGSPAGSVQLPTEEPVQPGAGGGSAVQPGRAEDGQALDAPQQPATDVDELAATETLAAESATSSADGSPTTEAPKRSRRKRRRKPRTAQGALPEAPVTPPAEATAAPAAAAPEAVPPTVAPAAEEPPPAEKATRARRPRKPKVAAATAAATAEPAPADTPSVEAPVAEAPKAAPAKRRTRKKTAAEKPAEADGEAPAAEAKPAKTPRKPRSRAKPPPEEPEAEEAAEAGVPVAKKKPAPRATRARKAPAEPAAPAAPAPDGDAPAPKKAPRRRKAATTGQP